MKKIEIEKLSGIARKNAIKWNRFLDEIDFEKSPVFVRGSAPAGSPFGVISLQTESVEEYKSKIKREAKGLSFHTDLPNQWDTLMHLYSVPWLK